MGQYWMRLTLPCRLPIFPCHSLRPIFAAPSVWVRALGVGVLGARRGTACGRCPCGLFRAVRLAVSWASLPVQLQCAGFPYLIARIHIHPSPKAMIQSSVLQIVLWDRYSQTTRGDPMSALCANCHDCGVAASCSDRAAARVRTYPFDAIVTIGANSPCGVGEELRTAGL